MSRRHWTLIGIAAFALIASVLLARGEWSVLISLAIAVIALAPGYLIVRQIIRPREEAGTTWQKALIGPAIVGAGLGWLAGEIVDGLRNCTGEGFTCLGSVVMVMLFGIPLAALMSCLALWAARTQRPWLTAPVGLIISVALIIAYSALAAAEAGVLVYTLSFLGGYLLASLAIGQLLPVKARLAVYVAALALLPVAGLLQAQVQQVHTRASLERLTIPLLTSDVPGYKLVEADPDEQRNTLYLTLQPHDSDTDRDYARQVTVFVVPLPPDFDPQSRCEPPLSTSDPWRPCAEQVDTDLWRAESPDDPCYVVRRENAVIVVSGGIQVPAGTVLQAATSLRPATPHELAR